MQIQFTSTTNYVSSTTGFYGRWSTYKWNLTRGTGECCGFCAHWKLHHKDNCKDFPKFISTFWTIVKSQAENKGTISNLQIFFGKLTNCQTTFCQPSFYPPFILPNFFCANLQFTKYILPNLHFLDFWKTYKFPSLCQIFILPNLHFAKPFSL